MKDDITCIMNAALTAAILILLFVVLVPKHLNVALTNGLTTSTIYCPIIGSEGPSTVQSQNIIFSKVYKDMEGDTQRTKVDILKGGTVIDCYSDTILSPFYSDVLYEAHVQSAHFLDQNKNKECIIHGNNCAIQVETY
jgi:hypothetical protein